MNRRITLFCAIVCLSSSMTFAQAPAGGNKSDPGRPVPGAAPVAPGNPAPVPDAPGGKPEELPFKVRVVPQSMNINTSINFDEQGRAQNEYQNFNMSMQLIIEGKANVMVCRNLVIDKFVTDSGEAIRPDANNIPREFNMGRDPFNRNVNQGNPNRFGFSMQLPMPQRPAKQIAEFSGSIEVEYSTGIMKQAMLEPWSDFDGKRTRIAEIPDSLVIVTRPDPNSVKVELSNKLWGQLSQVRFFDENGHEMNVNGWNGGGNNGMTYRQFKMTMSDKGKLALEFFPQVKTFRVPFTLKKIPLPRMNQGQSIDAVVESHELREIPAKPAVVEVLKAQVDRGG